MFCKRCGREVSEYRKRCECGQDTGLSRDNYMGIGAAIFGGFAMLWTYMDAAETREPAGWTPLVLGIIFAIIGAVIGNKIYGKSDTYK